MSKIIIYQAKSEAIEFKRDFENETVWATQKQLAQLFDVNVKTVNEHIQNIFQSNELNENSVIRKFRITEFDGKLYNTKHYNLDAIISVGYRVNSKNATQFRILATKTLKEFMTKGFVINRKQIHKNYKEFLKQLNRFKDYELSLLIKARLPIFLLKKELPEVSRVLCEILCNHLEAKMFIQALKKNPLTYFILLSKTTPL